MRTSSTRCLVAVLLGLTPACSVEMGSLAEPAPPASASATSPLATPSEEATRARSPALLASELSGLEERFASLPKNAPDRPALARRIAEDYVEAENAALRAKMQAVVDRDPSREAEAGATVTRARAGALKYYRLLVDEHPSYPELDKVLYYLAYEYEQAGDSVGARKAYFELIQKRPSSRYVPNAYLAFGEMFFNEAAADPVKWELARQAYQKVIAYPPPPNEVYGYAWYKLAYVLWNTNELRQALAAFKKTIDYGAAFPELPNASKLADSARRDILAVYAQVGDPKSAYAFFRGLSGDPPGHDDKTLRMLKELHQGYVDIGHQPEADALQTDLAARAAAAATSSSAP